MAETSNIARMASKVTDEVFGVLGWTRVGPQDQNWDCANPQHGKVTHPSDVVFMYDEPYRAERVIWNVDLKSYASESVTRASIGSAVSNLALAVDCANVAPGWHELYGDLENNYRCDGLLFVYNHDGAFDKNFPELLAGVDATKYRVSARKRLAILGPQDVEYVANVAHDIIQLRGRQQIPLPTEATEFWYPDMVRPKLRPQPRSAATIEMLTGPWITLLIRPDYNDGKRRFLVYYRGAGDTMEEFRYLIDSFFRFQMLALDRDTAIDVRLVKPGKTATVNFQRAKASVSTALYGLAHNRLELVRCETIPNVLRSFSEVDLGMESR